MQCTEYFGNEFNTFFQLEMSAREQKIDQSLVSMVVNDLVPPSMIEDKGFKEFVSVLDLR